MTTTPASARHEALHVAAAHQVTSYLALSRDQAAAGDTRRAVLSIWAADVATLQCLLWESGLGRSPDPDSQLAAVGHSVLESLRVYAEQAGPATPREFIDHARTAMTATFDQAVNELLSTRFVPTDHLSGLSVVEHDAWLPEDSRVPLEGRSAEQLVKDLRTTATDCTAVAQAMLAAGFEDDAREQTQMAGLACFEAHLLDVALAVGDTALLSVDLRWQLATRLLTDTTNPSTVSDILLDVVGPDETVLLVERLQDLVVSHA